MTWKPTQITNDEIFPADWNEFAQCLLNVSGNAIPFSSAARGKFAGSSNINRTLLDTISGALDDKIDAVSLGSITGPLAGTIGSNFNYGISGLQYISSQKISGGQIIGGLHHSADYIIYKVGATYYAIAGSTNTIVDSGTSAGKIIQSAINAKSSSLIYVADNITLTHSITGQYRRRLDFGGHTILCDFNGNGKKAFRMHAAFQVVNARIDAGMTNSFSGASVFSFWGGDRFGTGVYWWERGALVENCQLYGINQTTYTNIGANGNVSASGTAIRLYTNGDNQEVGMCRFNDIAIFGFRYGIRLESKDSVNGSAWINVNRFNNFTIEYCDYDVSLERSDAHGTYPELNGNYFDNFNIEVRGNTRRVIRCDGKSNQFTNWSIMDADQSSWKPLVDFTDDSENNYFSGWGAVGYVSTRYFSDSGNENSFYETLLGPQLSTKYITGPYSGTRHSTYTYEGEGLTLYASPMGITYGQYPQLRLNCSSLTLGTKDQKHVIFQDGTASTNPQNMMRVSHTNTTRFTSIQGPDTASSGLRIYARNQTSAPYIDIRGDGDLICLSSAVIKTNGKITATGGVDPPYVLYDYETRKSIIKRTDREVEFEKRNGAVLFFNGESQKLEVYLPCGNCFTDVLGNKLDSMLGL